MNIVRWPVLGLATLALAACGSTTATGGSTTSAPPPTSSTTSATTGPSTPASTAHPTTGVGPCKASGVRIAWAAGGAAAGTDFGYVVVTNTGPQTCLLSGVPELFHVTKSGEEVGAVAVPDAATAPAPVIRLASGKQAAAEYADGNALNYPATTCKPVAVPGISVTLPHDTRQTFLAVPGEACANDRINTLTVKPFSTDFQPVGSTP